MNPQLHPAGTEVLARLARVATARGPHEMGERLGALERFVRADLVDLDAELATIERGPKVVVRAAHHLLDLGGKHLRPLCVALASKLGNEGFTPRARSLAVAVELVHTATLLHDDVVDVAERRRGQPAARAVYGNAASIFAGDWLLVAALRKITATGEIDLLEQMLAVIDEMILAESVQLERRGTLVETDAMRKGYFEVVEGKTAALFRWAMIAGARAGGLARSQSAALERFGFHLGVAFQAVDDELDFAEGTGKDPCADLREGKVTYPLLVALEREPALRPRIAALLATDVANSDELAAIAAIVKASGALKATRELAEEHVAHALLRLEELPAGPARDALITVALASLERAS